MKWLLQRSPMTLFYRESTARNYHAPEGWVQRGLVHPHHAIFPRNLIRAFSAISFSFSSYLLALTHTKHLSYTSSPQVVPLCQTLLPPVQTSGKNIEERLFDMFSMSKIATLFSSCSCQHKTHLQPSLPLEPVSLRTIINILLMPLQHETRCYTGPW